jgi:hypothetical protein
MGCNSCQKINGVCKVCELLDNDSTIKVVTFCASCNVYICEKCESDITRRFPAYLKTKVNQLKKIIKDVIS